MWDHQACIEVRLISRFIETYGMHTGMGRALASTPVLKIANQN